MKNILIPAAFCATSFLALAGPTTTTEIAPPAQSSNSGDWQFKLQPYSWLTGIEGTSGPIGFPTDIDAGFDEVFDVLEMAAAMQFEARKDRWGFIADAFYAELGDSGTLPGPLQTNVDVDFTQFIGEFVVFYRVSEAPLSFLDIYAGVRYNSISLDLKATNSGTLLPINASRSGDDSWTDPIIGLRSQWEINDNWYLAAKGDIGGFGAASDFTWNIQASVGYRFNDALSLEVGYRYFDTDYSDSNFTYDIAQSGALIGLTYAF